MNKFRLVFLVFFLILNIGFSQTKSEISVLLDGISKTHNSKDIEKSNDAKKIMNYGWQILPMLSEFFNDQKVTKPTELKAGDLIRLGSYILKFNEKPGKKK